MYVEKDMRMSGSGYRLSSSIKKSRMTGITLFA